MSDMTTVVPPEVEVGRRPTKPADQCTAAELRSVAPPPVVSEACSVAQFVLGTLDRPVMRPRFWIGVSPPLRATPWQRL